MNLNCSSVNFTGSVDKSVYKWANQIKKEAHKQELDKANHYHKPLDTKKLEEIDNRVDAMLQVLEEKATAMHPDTVISIDQPNKAKSNRFLCVHNEKIMNEMRQTPASNSYQSWGVNDSSSLDYWKVHGENPYIGAPNAYMDCAYGKNAIELLEFRINDINEKQTDKQMINNAIEEVLEDAEWGTQKPLLKKIKGIIQVQEDLDMQLNWVEKAYNKMKVSDEHAEIRKQNEAAFAKYNKKSKKESDSSKTGILSKIASWFK